MIRSHAGKIVGPMEPRPTKMRINLNDGSSTLARNRCSQCEFEWADKPFGLARHMNCPKCGSEYWEWLNYGNADE